jgi:diadenosine tetraphosphate (Ap4A) HIT family hydrolase
MTSSTEKSCAFCGIDRIRVLEENELAFATRDGFPVVPLHSLVVPKRHVPDYFSITEAEQLACLELLHALRKQILGEDSTVAGFNVGINVGAEAGQTVEHCHIHLIPRRAGDVPNPRGGIRHIIPRKGFY